MKTVLSGKSIFPPLIIFLFFLPSGLPGQQHDLGYFLDAGLRNSPLLKDYSNRVRSARIDSLKIIAGQKFHVNATSNNYYAPVVKGYGLDEVKTDLAEVSAVVQVSKEITWNKNLQNKYEAIRLQNQSAMLEGNLSARELKKTITSQYILTYSDQRYVELSSEILRMLKEEEQIVRRLAESGSYRQTEYLSFLVNMRQQELVSAQFQSSYITDFETLNYLCGIYDTTRYSLADPGLTSVSPIEIRNTLFYRQYTVDSLRIANSDRQIDFEYQPRLSVFADGGYLSSFTITPWKNFGLSAGVTLTVPIYDGRQRQMQHDQAAISESTRSNYAGFFRNQYMQQVAILEHQLTSAAQMNDKILGQQKYSRALVDANRVLLSKGDISVNDYILSVNSWLEANNMLIDNATERFRIINELNYWREK